MKLHIIQGTQHVIYAGEHVLATLDKMTLHTTENHDVLAEIKHNKHPRTTVMSLSLLVNSSYNKNQIKHCTKNVWTILDIVANMCTYPRLIILVELFPKLTKFRLREFNQIK